MNGLEWGTVHVSVYLCLVPSTRGAAPSLWRRTTGVCVRPFGDEGNPHISSACGSANVGHLW